MIVDNYDFYDETVSEAEETKSVEEFSSASISVTDSPPFKRNN